MANIPPIVPEIGNNCVIEPVSPGYYTDQQSVINVSRKDKFILVMDVPCALQPFLKKEKRPCQGGNIDRLRFSVWGSVIPDIAVETIKHNHGGQTLKFSGNARPEYPPINCNFTVDNQYDNYYILWKWLDIQNTAMEGFSQDRIKTYSTTISIFPLSEYDEPVAEFIYYDAFITGIGGINISKRDADETESTFTFEFSQLNMKLV